MATLTIVLVNTETKSAAVMTARTQREPDPPSLSLFAACSGICPLLPCTEFFASQRLQVYRKEPSANLAAGDVL